MLAATGEPAKDEINLLTPFKEHLPDSCSGSAWTPPATGTQAAIRTNRLAANDLLEKSRMGYPQRKANPYRHRRSSGF